MPQENKPNLNQTPAAEGSNTKLNKINKRIIELEKEIETNEISRENK